MASWELMAAASPAAGAAAAAGVAFGAGAAGAVEGGGKEFGGLTAPMVGPGPGGPTAGGKLMPCIPMGGPSPMG